MTVYLIHRLLDGIQINLKGGRANVNFTPEVKIKLTSGNQHIPLRSECKIIADTIFNFQPLLTGFGWSLEVSAML